VQPGRQRHVHSIYVFVQEFIVTHYGLATKAGGKLIGFLLRAACHGCELQLRYLLDSRYYRAAGYIGTAHNANTYRVLFHEWIEFNVFCYCLPKQVNRIFSWRQNNGTIVSDC
jgi:hypothetical protein